MKYLMISKYIVNKPIWTQLQQFIKCAYNQSGKGVEEAALLQRQIRELFSNLMNTGLENYRKIDSFYHNVETDSIGSFTATICFDKESNTAILYIKSWNWRINPHVFPTLYSLLLSRQPIYDIISTDNCGFSIIKDARGYFNHINNQKQVISKEWFQKVTPFQNINGFIFAYVRRLNGDACYVFSDGTLGRIDDNYTRQNAQALLGESQIHQIIMEVLNQYLKQNLILN